MRREAEAPKPSLLQRAIPAAMRIVPTVAGGFLGSALGPLGTAAGGAAGASLGEYAAETYEQLTGQRGEINPTQVAVQGALGAIPLADVAYHGILGEIVRAIEPETEADPAGILVQMLVMFGNVIGRSVRFRVGADLHHLNLFAGIVGHLMAALEVWRYAYDSAAYLFGDRLGDPTADEILAALKSCWPESLTRSDVSRTVLQRNKSAAEIDRAFALLLDCRLARYEPDRTGGGRPAERWSYLPPTHDMSETSLVAEESNVVNFVNVVAQVSPRDAATEVEEVEL